MTLGIEIGVDMTPEGAHVIAMYVLPNGTRCVFYSQFHPQQRTWVGLTDKDLAVCGDEDDVMLARYWERVCKEKNNA